MLSKCTHPFFRSLRPSSSQLQRKVININFSIQYSISKKPQKTIQPFQPAIQSLRHEQLQAVQTPPKKPSDPMSAVEEICKNARLTSSLDHKKFEELHKIIISSNLSPKDLDAITRLLTDIIKKDVKFDDKRNLERLVRSTSNSVNKMLQGGPLDSQPMIKAINLYISYSFNLGYGSEELLKQTFAKSLESACVFTDINSFSQLVFSLCQLDYRKIDPEQLKQLYRRNESSLESQCKSTSKYKTEGINSVAYILHCFNRLQLPITEMDKVLVLCEKSLAYISPKNLIFLMRLVCKDESSYTKHAEVLKKHILKRLKELDLTSLSQFLYAFFKISEHIDQCGLDVPEITKVIDEFQAKLDSVPRFGSVENKAVSTLLIFLREFLYDDTMLLERLCEYVTENKYKCEFFTASMLAHTIASLNLEPFFYELEGLYDIAFTEARKIKEWTSTDLEGLKLIWCSMAISEAYSPEYIETIREIFEKNISKVNLMSLKTLLINTYDITLNQKWHPKSKKQFELVQTKILQRYYSSIEHINTHVLTDTVFQDQVAEVFRNKGIEFEQEQRIKDIFFADFRIKDTNKIVECLGPAHFTLVEEKLKGSYRLRLRVLERMGNEVIVIKLEDWVKWKAHNTTGDKLVSLVKGGVNSS